MVVFPNCKINLGLHITGKRADGFHNIETVFYPIPFTDILEIIAAAGTRLSCTGLPVGGKWEDNLCYKAWHLLKQEHARLPAVNMHLHKVIPSGAGLGGGSSDAAHTLVLLNRKFHLCLSQEALLLYAARLGSDCPFFILNRPAYAYGRGEALEPASVNLEPYRLVLVNPRIHISTAWAFAQIQAGPVHSRPELREIMEQPPETWPGLLVNEFEKPVEEAHPEVGAVRKTLYQAGALYASLTGSGSTVFGIFRSAPENMTSLFPPQYLVKVL